MTGRIPILPQQFAKLAALYRSSTYEAERDTARRKAEAILPPEAGGFDRALRIQAYEEVRVKAPSNPLAGFEEYQEIDNPGQMAARVAKRAEKRRQQDARRTELLAEFGSFDAVLKPGAMEKAMLAAVKPWRKAQPGSRGRWTATIAGLDTYDHRKAPAEVTAALKAAWPMPATYAEAVREVEWWRQRNDDMELAATADGGMAGGDYMLDTPAVWRMWIVRDLADHGMELHTLPEIIARLRAYRQSESGHNVDVEDAVLRDLDALVVGVGGKVQMPEVCRGAPLFDVMAERLRLGVGAAAGPFMYRNESEDVLAYTLTGMKSGPERDAALAIISPRLDVATRAAGAEEGGSDAAMAGIDAVRGGELRHGT